MIVLLVGFLLIAILWYHYRYRRRLTYIQETMQFFSTQETPWLSPEQLTRFMSCSSNQCYSRAISTLQAPKLIRSMLIGQPLRYIWSDRNTNELIRYLKSLRQYRIPYSDSITGHSSLYTEEYGEWPQGMNIIRAFTQTS